MKIDRSTTKVKPESNPWRAEEKNILGEIYYFSLKRLIFFPPNSKAYEVGLWKVFGWMNQNYNQSRSEGKENYLFIVVEELER